MSYKPNIVIEERVEQAQITRSDVADVKRSIQTLNKQADHIRRSLDQQLTTSSRIEPNTTVHIINKRNDLNMVNQQIKQLEVKLSSYMPTPSSAKLNDKEQQEIRGLYSSGRYTQKELAEQYGVTQPTISDIVKK